MFVKYFKLCYVSDINIWGVKVYIFMFVKKVMHGLFYSLPSFSFNTYSYVCAFYHLYVTNWVRRGGYFYKCHYSDSLLTK
jgi:hypothetical protein